jgi:hypothetical protein
MGIEPICKLGNRNSNKKILVYGDSHVYHLLSQLESQVGKDYLIDVIYFGGCFMGDKISFDLGNKIRCDQKIELLKSLKGSKHELIITGQRWGAYGVSDAADVKDAIEDRINVFGINAKKIVIVGSTGNIPFNCEKSRMRPHFGPKECQQDEQSIQTNLRFIETVSEMNLPSNTSFAFPFKHLCPMNRCIVLVDGVLNYRDDHHLTHEGAKSTVSEIVRLLNSN